MQLPMQRHGPLAEGTSRRLYVTRCVIGGLTGLLLLCVLAIYTKGDVSPTFTDLGETAVALLAAVRRPADH